MTNPTTGINSPGCGRRGDDFIRPKSGHEIFGHVGQLGELIRIDSKKLKRIAGNRHGQSNRRVCGQGLDWEALQIAIDDAYGWPAPRFARREKSERNRLP
ncbi:hypothetical protein QEZ48_20925 [Aquamicrobium lusatiense]|uniref:hypothetical protein n=1 Tax=Aquamicrobium TaxID=69278 RepID=UPI0024558548|nr:MULTISPECIES: hypothetical protein [Aquamicrobium]MCK9553884.1 hypothetical protein [Aquamicrobium sp.]MDH4993280.1 hypothetical protein [Aquamicrobium lusatiense]